MSWGSSFSGYQLFAKQVQRCGRWNPRVASTVYFQLSKGLPTQYGDLVVATCDASVPNESSHGIALSLAIRPGQVNRLESMRFDGVSIIVTFEDTPRRMCTGRRLEPQWQCGSCGACLNSEIELFCSVMTACLSFCQTKGFAFASAPEGGGIRMQGSAGSRLPCARIACARRTAYRRANRRRFMRRGAQAGGSSRHPAHKKRGSSSVGAIFLDCDYRSLRCPEQRFCETPRISDRRAQHRGKTRSLCAAGTSLAAPMETNVGNPVSYFSQGAWCAPLSVKLSQLGSSHDLDGSSDGNHTRRRSSRSCGESRRLSTEAWWRDQVWSTDGAPRDTGC
jgi:hypothetical protein